MIFQAICNICNIMKIPAKFAGDKDTGAIVVYGLVTKEMLN